MARPLVYAANWKMHHGPAVAREFARRFVEVTQPQDGRELWFFPTAVALAPLADAFARRADVRVGAQNVHWEPKGAFTGEISVGMLKEAGCTHVIIGHSERRQFFGETNETVCKRLVASLGAGLVPLVCVGETLAERDADATEAVIARQVESACGSLRSEQLASCVIAYEPVWAIGTGRTATPGQAQEVHHAIRRQLTSLGSATTAERVRIIYGGSVKPDNIDALMAEPDIDGALVGGASLDADSFTRIVKFQ